MPTSSRRFDNRGSTFIPAIPARKVSGRCGHRPLREREPFSIHRGPSWTSLGPLHTRHGFAVPPSPSRRGLWFYRKGSSKINTALPVGLSSSQKSPLCLAAMLSPRPKTVTPNRFGSRKSQRFMCLSMVSSLLQGFIIRGEYSSFISSGYLKTGAAESSSGF